MGGLIRKNRKIYKKAAVYADINSQVILLIVWL